MKSSAENEPRDAPLAGTTYEDDDLSMARRRERLFRAATEAKELPDGYVFRLPPRSPMIVEAAEYVARERLHRPFFSFAVEVEPGGGIYLRITGEQDDVKPYVRDHLLDGTET
jgi:hypothetical protein